MVRGPQPGMGVSVNCLTVNGDAGHVEVRGHAGELLAELTLHSRSSLDAVLDAVEAQLVPWVAEEGRERRRKALERTRFEHIRMLREIGRRWERCSGQVDQDTELEQLLHRAARLAREGL